MRTGRRSVVVAIAVVGIQLAANTASSVDTPEFDEFHTTYRLTAKADDDHLCVDETGKVDVRVHADLSGHLRGAGWIALPNLGPGDMADALIHGRAQGDVVKLVEADRVTELHGAPGFRNAVFHFEAQKAGNSQLTFEVEQASMDDFLWPGDTTVTPTSVDITVVNCKFRLHVFSTFTVEGPAGLTFGTAMINVELSQSDDGQLRQSADLQWFAWAGQVGDCMGSMAARTSEANVFGVLDKERGTLSVDVKYEPFHISLTGNCGSFETDLTPTALHFDVPTTGGSGDLSQDLSSPLGGASGAASWAIYPDDD